MKFKSVTGKSIGDNAPVVLGAVGGAMVGRGLTAVLSKPAGATPTQQELNKKTLIQGAMAVAGFVAYTAIDGNDTAANATKGAALGIAIDNTISVIGSLLAKNETVQAKLAADTTTNRFAKAALGLGCPSCDANKGYHTPYLNKPRARSLRMPIPEFNQAIESMPFSSAINSGQQMARVA